MKQKSQNSQLFLLTNNSSNEDEFEVANILLDLDNLVIQRQFGSLIWGCKKKRSNRCIDFSSSSVCIQQQKGCLKVDDEHHEIDKAKIKVEVVTSPATPLSFSPSESDDKSKHSSRKSYKRKTREELMDNIKELSQCREMLRGVTKMLNIQGGGVNLGQLYNNSGMEPSHQQPFIMDQVAIHRYQYPLGQLQQQAQPFFSNRLGLGLGPGPMVLPDLNVSVDEAFTLDRFDIDRMNAERKAQFAEARRRRRIKRIEVKNSSGFIRPPRRR
ncbi:hypothetical protein CQW23_11110 [Capsicum baccatum]|uniref:Uncharacterized protein n=1 Tax=Capsicum baccatum TaxID=33114 RepID=A0A2G2X1N5_CAPBA|nr:hypothetical protein CQW23_11110 [Capsicum baccatum]